MQIIGPGSDDVERLMRRCQSGFHGRGALDKAHDTITECYSTMRALMQARDALAEYVSKSCQCPCCGRAEWCESSCTFWRDDAPAYERIQHARLVLFEAE